ncbi:MAG: hypothetical protein II661_09395 [Bacteroidales bacterium]|nr:hypothetical protein [Bacteroidales bacterium]
MKKVQWTFDSDRRERRIKASLMTLLTLFDFDFSGVRSLRQKYWAWLAPIAKRPTKPVAIPAATANGCPTVSMRQSVR